MNRKSENQARYDKRNTTQICLKLNDFNDMDILAWMERQRMNPNTSVQGEIKKLIRRAISEENIN